MNIKYLLQDIKDYLRYRKEQYKDNLKKTFNKENFIFGSIILLIVLFVRGNDWKIILLALIFVLMIEFKEFKIGLWKKWMRGQYGRIYKKDIPKKEDEPKMPIL